MRSCDCYYYMFMDGKLFRNSNAACWKGLDHKTYTWHHLNYPPTSFERPETIYIKDFEYVEMNKIVALVNIINKITPCSIEDLPGGPYIKYDLICEGRYPNNLVLLNFIRNCWYKPTTSFNIGKFFEDLLTYNGEEDPLYFLMRISVKNTNLIDVKYFFEFGHCNIGRFVKPKTTEHLLNYTGEYHTQFMTCKPEEILIKREMKELA